MAILYISPGSNGNESLISVRLRPFAGSSTYATSQDFKLSSDRCITTYMVQYFGVSVLFFVARFRIYWSSFRISFKTSVSHARMI